MGFGNEDVIDKRNRERIRELEIGLRSLINAFSRSTSMSQGEKEQTILEAKNILRA